MAAVAVYKASQPVIAVFFAVSLVPLVLSSAVLAETAASFAAVAAVSKTCIAAFSVVCSVTAALSLSTTPYWADIKLS